MTPGVAPFFYSLDFLRSYVRLLAAYGIQSKVLFVLALADREISNVLIEGGSRVIGNALQNNLVDKMMIYTAPKIMGEGIDAVRGIKAGRLSGTIGLKDISIQQIGGDLLVEGYI